MCINEQLDYDKNVANFFGYATLGSKKNLLGQKLFLVVVRGVKNNWKQVVASHVTRNKLKQFILDCISRVEECGLCFITFFRLRWTKQITLDFYGNKGNEVLQTSELF